MIKRVIEIILSKLKGRKQRKWNTINGVGFQPYYLAQLCQPNTVIDVGVGYGTYALYEAFPKARFLLVEPLREYADAIEKIARRYDCDSFYKAVGNTQDFQEMNVDTHDLQKSSFANRTPLSRRTVRQFEKRTIEVTTLDRLIRDTPALKEPILLKIDTEGHELKVLQGSQDLLRATEIVIAEVSIARRFEESYEFEDVILFMKENGFYVLTFLYIDHPEGELRPRFADIVFKRRQGNQGASPARFE